MTTQPARAVADRANAAIANDGVQAAQRIQLNCARGSATGDATRCRAIEHYHDRAMMVVILAPELEQEVDVRTRDAALLHPRLGMSSDARLHERVRKAACASFVFGMMGSGIGARDPRHEPIIRVG